MKNLTYKKNQPGDYTAYNKDGVAVAHISRLNSHKWEVVTSHGRSYSYSTLLECEIYVEAIYGF